MLCGLLAGVAGWLDLSLAGLASPAFEELLNARSAVLVACGHMDSVADLQYRSFCGGCTADALVGALPAWVSGGSVSGWKLVPLLFHCLATGCVVALALAASSLLWL